MTARAARSRSSTGATRGAGRGTAVALGEAGATVYCTGRSTREQRSEYDRPETIEETAELVDAAGGTGIAVAVDHLEPAQVEALVQRIDAEQGRLDVLVNDIWGGEKLVEWNTPVWEHDLDERAADAAAGDRHPPDHEPLRAAAADPPARRARGRDDRRHAEYNAAHYRALGLLRPGEERRRSGWPSPRARSSRRTACTAVALTPGWLRSEMMLEHLRRDRGELARGERGNPHFAAISESPRFVGRAVAALAADPDVARRNGGSFSSGGLAREYGFTDVDGSQPDCLALPRSRCRTRACRPTPPATLRSGPTNAETCEPEGPQVSTERPCQTAARMSSACARLLRR